MTNSSLTVQRGLRAHFFRQAAVLYDDAFGPKFAFAIPRSTSRRRMLESCFSGEFAFTVIENGQLIGLAGFNTSDGALTGGGSLKGLISELGLFSTLRAIAVFALFERTPKVGELVMDGIAVKREHRGRGVGAELLDCIALHARSEGYKTVRLDVIGTNPRAKKLYEKKGFKAKKTEYFPYLKWVLGFSSSTTMVLTVSES